LLRTNPLPNVVHGLFIHTEAPDVRHAMSISAGHSLPEERAFRMARLEQNVSTETLDGDPRGLVTGAGLLERRGDSEVELAPGATARSMAEGAVGVQVRPGVGTWVSGGRCAQKRGLISRDRRKHSDMTEGVHLIGDTVAGIGLIAVHLPVLGSEDIGSGGVVALEALSTAGKAPATSIGEARDEALV
jgi:hypothetical protein